MSSRVKCKHKTLTEKSKIFNKLEKGVKIVDLAKEEMSVIHDMRKTSERLVFLKQYAQHLNLDEFFQFEDSL